jgi:hypothetical protein
LQFASSFSSFNLFACNICIEQRINKQAITHPYDNSKNFKAHQHLKAEEGLKRGDTSLVFWFAYLLRRYAKRRLDSLLALTVASKGLLGL